MSDDIVKYLRLSRTRFNRHAEAADEIERLRELMKAFVSAWERSELGENNGTEYFNAVHAIRKEVRGE